MIEEIIRPEPTTECVEDVAFSTYLATKALSGSPIVTGIQKSPKHLLLAYETETPSTDAMRIGRATDCLLFDCILPSRQRHSSQAAVIQDAIEQFQSRFPVWGGGRRFGNKWDEFQDEHGDDYLRDRAEYEKVMAQVSAVATDKIALPYWETGIAQATLLAGEGDIQCKGRPDWVSTSQEHIVDLKTTADITRFWRVAFDKGYDIKLALYRRWWAAITGDLLPCVCVVVEQEPPHDVAVVPFPPSILDAAEVKFERLLPELRQSIETGVWRGVAGDAEYPLFVPGWMQDDEELDWEGLS